MASFTRHLHAENKAPSTVVTYGKAVVQLDAFLERSGLPRGVGAVRREHVEAYLVDLQARGARPAIVAQRFRSLQQFWKRSAGIRALARGRCGSAGGNRRSHLGHSGQVSSKNINRSPRSSPAST